MITQNFPNLEHIIIDGGFLDNTCEIINKKMSHVDKFISEPDNGIYDAMNKGIDLATGDVIGFLNSDDFYFSSNVLTQIGKLFSEENIDSCYGDLCYFALKNIEKISVTGSQVIMLEDLLLAVGSHRTQPSL